jgi:polysaccharide biosynthesis protein PslH
MRRLEQVATLVASVQPDAVVSVGLDALPYLAAVPDGTRRIWYTADEWVRHHLSLVSWRDRQSWSELKPAIVKGLYERAYARLVDAAWVVSPEEQVACRRWAGMAADIVANGVDSDAFQPAPGVETQPDSAVFWGTLDFEPNIQGLQWFLAEVWPRVRQARPSATLSIIGLRPLPVVREMAVAPGVELIADAPAVQPLVVRRQVVVLPFVSGGGIKNKLLEAAAMGMPIVVTSTGTEGLVARSESGLAVHDRAAAFADAVLRLWDNPAGRAGAGERNRRWVTTHHSWAAAGRAAAASALRNPSSQARPAPGP